MKNSIFARFARAFFIFWHFEDVLVLSTTWNDLFCSCVDDVSIWWQMFKFVFLCPKRWFQFNSRIVRTHFSSIMSLNNWKMIAETRSYIFRWRSRFRRRRVCFSSLVSIDDQVINSIAYHLLNQQRNYRAGRAVRSLKQIFCTYVFFARDERREIVIFDVLTNLTRAQRNTVGELQGADFTWKLKL